MIKTKRVNKNDTVYQITDNTLLSVVKKLNVAITNDNEFRISNDDDSTIKMIDTVVEQIIKKKLEAIEKRKANYEYQEQGSQNWLNDRQRYITSTAPRDLDGVLDRHALRIAIIKKYPHLLSLLGEEDKLTASQKMNRGEKFEPLVRDYVNQSKDEDFKPIIAKNGLYMASLDGLNSEKNRILEIKTTTVLNFFSYKLDPQKAIDRYKPQMIHQQGVTGIRDTLLVVYSPVIDEYLFLNFTASEKEIVELFEQEAKAKKTLAEIEEELKKWI